MKRTACVLAFLLASATVAQAQSSGAPASSIGLPLPPIGLPLPVIGLQPEPESRLSLPPQGPREGKRRVPPPPPAIVIFGAPYAFGYETWQQSPQPGMIASPPETYVPDVPEAPEPTGRLRLELKPADAQVFVNGEYVGTWRDIDGELELPVGTHRIEIRAPRYEAVSFDVRIVADRTINYRGELTRIEEPRPQGKEPPAATTSPSPTPPPVQPASTIYLIPGCYLGNVPPEQVKLPAGCDPSKAITNKQ